MKTNILLLFVTLLTGYSSVFGQEEEPKTVKKISISNIYIQTGLFSEHNINGKLADFKELVPQSVLLNNDFKEYSSFDGFSLTNSTIFSMMLGIKFSDKQKTTYKTNPQLRMGVSYFLGTSLTGGLYKENRKPYDTLTSTQTGLTAYIDSVATYNYNMDYTSEQLRFDGSLIFRTDPQTRWTLFTGIGITAGISFNAHTFISYYKIERSEINYPDGNTYSSYSFSGTDNYKTEKFRNKNNFGLSTYIPMGIDFRIGKKNEFWKQIHLYYELRPGINITSIPELRTITNSSIQNGLGLKVTWD